MGCHLLLEAVRVLCDESELPAVRSAAAGEEPRGRPLVEELAWRLRSAFFAEARNVGERAVQHEIAESLGLPLGAIDARIANGRAFAALSADAELQRTHAVQGSPTWLLNEGRQKLYGNVGYRVIEANLREALAAGTRELASWC
jgi:predicted DsbA family dithiol-disulfide isomerase